VREENSLSLLLMSKEPSYLEKELERENLRLVKTKRQKARVLLPMNSKFSVQGLETILEENESEFEHLYREGLENENDIDTYLTIMEKNPEKGRTLIMNQGYAHTGHH
jgi:hypothetical protein